MSRGETLKAKDAAATSWDFLSKMKLRIVQFQMISRGRKFRRCCQPLE